MRRRAPFYACKRSRPPANRHDKNDAIIYDYVDENVPVLTKMHELRRAVYKALGYEIMVEMPSSQQPSFKRF